MFGASVKTSLRVTLRFGALIALVASAGCAQSGNREAVIRCTPGDHVAVSCGCLGLGSACDGNAGIRLCDATLANGECTDAQAVTIAGQRDQCEDGCPLATTYCPASGMLAVSTFAYEDYLGETGAYACRWSARVAPVVPAHPTATFACTPGELVTASCGCEGLGRRCEGDPAMRACVPGTACNDTSSSLAYDDDECGNCPLVRATCPSTGTILIATQSFSGSSSPYRCDVGASGDRSGILRVASGI